MAGRRSRRQTPPLPGTARSGRPRPASSSAVTWSSRSTTLAAAHAVNHLVGLSSASLRLGEQYGLRVAEADAALDGGASDTSGARKAFHRSLQSQYTFACAGGPSALPVLECLKFLGSPLRGRSLDPTLTALLARLALPGVASAMRHATNVASEAVIRLRSGRGATSSASSDAIATPPAHQSAWRRCTRSIDSRGQKRAEARLHWPRTLVSFTRAARFLVVPRVKPAVPRQFTLAIAIHPRPRRMVAWRCDIDARANSATTGASSRGAHAEACCTAWTVAAW